MLYKDAVKQSMEMLAEDEKVVFVGYNVNYGSRVYGTLKDIPKEKCLEMPVAENLMAGMCLGMALEGYKPVLIFERHDFIPNALDSLVNHLDKVERMSDGEFTAPVIIRALLGSRKPLDPGIQHTQDFTDLFKQLFTFPVYDLRTSEEVITNYTYAKSANSPIMLVERKDLYDTKQHKKLKIYLVNIKRDSYKN